MRSTESCFVSKLQHTLFVLEHKRCYDKADEIERGERGKIVVGAALKIVFFFFLWVWKFNGPWMRRSWLDKNWRWRKRMNERLLL